MSELSFPTVGAPSGSASPSPTQLLVSSCHCSPCDTEGLCLERLNLRRLGQGIVTVAQQLPLGNSSPEMGAREEGAHLCPVHDC